MKKCIPPTTRDVVRRASADGKRSRTETVSFLSFIETETETNKSNGPNNSPAHSNYYLNY